MPQQTQFNFLINRMLTNLSLCALLFATVFSAQIPSEFCDLAAATVLVSLSTPTSVLCGLQELRMTSLSDLSTLTTNTYVDALNDKRLSQELEESRRKDTCIINFNRYEVQTGVDMLLKSDQEMIVAAKVVAELKTQKLGLLQSPDDHISLPILQLFNPNTQINVLILPESLERNSLKSLLRREVKALGLGFIVFATSPKQTFTILQALITIESGPMTLLFTHSAAQFRLYMETSLLERFVLIILAEGGCEDAISECELIKCKLKVGFSRSESSSVLMISNNSETLIGNITHSAVSICHSCIYASGNHYDTSEHISPISLCFNNGTNNYNGNADNGEQEMYWGAELAVMDVNNSTDLLNGFRLNLFNVSLGLNLFDAAWATANMRGVKRSDMGVAFLHGHYSNVAIPAYSFIANTLNFSIPQIAADNTSPLLSSQKNYPLYTRLTMSNTYLSVLYTNVLKRYGWKRLALLYCDDLFCSGLYEEMVKNTKAAGIEIVNQERRRKVSTNVTSDNVELVEVLKGIIASKVKIFVLILYGQSLFSILDALYSLGARRSDFQFFSIDWLNPSLFTVGSNTSLFQRKELLNGAIQFYPSAFSGSFGALVQSRFKAVFEEEPSHFACNHYDAVLLVAHAVDYLIAVGGEYEVTNVLHKAIRETRFVGCTGFVRIDDTSNDRSPMSFQILNAVVYPNGTANIAEVGTYNPTGLVLFNFTSNITWADGTANVPADTRTFDIDCPFDQSDIVLYPPGLLLCYFVILPLVIATMAFTIVSYRWLWNVPISPLTTPHEISFEDYTQYISIVIEALQYVAVGPDFLSLSPEFSNLTDSLSYRLERLVTLKKGLFWLVLNATLGLVMVWGVLLFIVIWNVERKLKCNMGVGDIGSRLLPLLGSVCFLPIVSMLLNVFQCLYASSIAEDLSITDSFLQDDCYQKCWSSPHIYYVCVALLGFAIYTPFAVYFRPYWQRKQFYLHIRSPAQYFLIKTLYQVTIIAGNKTMKAVIPLAHTISFYVLTVLFGIVTCKYRPYNYARANLWHFLSLISVLWLETLNLVSIVIGGFNHWFEIHFGGIVVIVAVGVIVQWRLLPSLLYSRKGPSITHLIRFQFGYSEAITTAERQAERYLTGTLSIGREFCPVRRVATMPNLCFYK